MSSNICKSILILQKKIKKSYFRIQFWGLLNVVYKQTNASTWKLLWYLHHGLIFFWIIPHPEVFPSLVLSIESNRSFQGLIFFLVIYFGEEGALTGPWNQQVFSPETLTLSAQLSFPVMEAEIILGTELLDLYFMKLTALRYIISKIGGCITMMATKKIGNCCVNWQANSMLKIYAWKLQLHQNNALTSKNAVKCKFRC